MPARRRSSATKSAKAATTPVKKSTSAKSKVEIREVVTKYSQPRQIKTVTETPTPAKVRPESPNLKWEDYRDDIKVRWQIHVYEVNELWSDCKKVYNNTAPYIIQAYNFSKDKYQSLTADKTQN